MSHLILLIEGKRMERPSYLVGMQKKGYKIESVSTGSHALKQLKKISPKAIVVDAASMRTTGTRICSSLKKESNDLPLILILSEDTEKLKNVEADEVLYLPFTLQKLTNRLDPYMTIDENKNVVQGPISLDLEERWLCCNGKRTRLTPRLFMLMEALMRKPGEILMRDELFRKIWETDYLGDTRSLDVHISWLRKAVETDPRHPELIKTERGLGYRLEIEKPKRPKKK